MTNHLQGRYTLVNESKYVGTHTPIYRSSWELSFMRMCDLHPNIIHWASEPLKIPYMNPVTGKTTIYIPDFLVEYIDSKNNRHCELVEVKPNSQTNIKEAKSKKDKIAVTVNMAKWEAAYKFCAKHGLSFRIVTEDNIYHNYKRK